MDWLNFIFKIVIPIVVGISVSLQFQEWCYQKAADEEKRKKDEAQRKKDEQMLKELKEILKKEKK